MLWPKFLLLGLAGASLIWSPISARSDTLAAVAGGMGTALVMGVVCAATATDGDDDDSQAFDRRGWLVGAKGSFALESFNVNSTLGEAVNLPPPRPKASSSFDDSYGVSGRVGYRCHSRFSADVQVEWVDTFDGDMSLAGLGKVATIEVQPLVVTANAKGYLLTGRFQPYLLAGAGGMTAKVNVIENMGLGLSSREREVGFVTRFGLGLDVFATRNLVVNVGADYVLPWGSVVEDLDFFSIGGGLEYRF